jgi:hypothetical protein
LTDYALYLITINRAFYLEKKNNSKNNGCMKREESKSAHAHEKTYTNVIMNKNKKKKKGMRLICFFGLFDGLYIWLLLSFYFLADYAIVERVK